jgi:hypothetical protein
MPFTQFLTRPATGGNGPVAFSLRQQESAGQRSTGDEDGATGWAGTGALLLRVMASLLRGANRAAFAALFHDSNT